MPEVSDTAKRLSVALIAGALGSFLLFTLLQSLLYQPTTSNPHEDITPIKVTTVYAAPSHTKPKETLEGSSSNKPSKPSTPLNALPPALAIPAMTTEMTSVPDSGSLLVSLPDLPALAPAVKPKITPESDVVTLFSVPPEYPSTAKRKGIEGWVDIRFTITANGSVEDMEIIDAQPPGIFERSALNAMKHYKFKPREISGKKVARKARQRLRFQP